MRTIQGYGLLLVLLVSSLGANWSQAQNYPSRPIRILTSGAGAGADVVARPVAMDLSGTMGQPVIVENRPSGFVLATAVSRAAPDGHTLLMWGGTLWTGPLFEEAPYDAVRDFAPITLLGRSPSILLVHPSLPVKTTAELIKLARARPGELNYASGANGGPPHLAGELFKSMASVDIVRVAYKSGALQVTDLLSGQVQMTFGSVATWGAQIKSGKVRAIATAGLERSGLLPDLPTVADALPGFESDSLLAFWAPAKTPDAIVRRLNQETLRVLAKPQVRELMLNNAQEPAGGTPEQLADIIKSDLARLSKIFKTAGKPGG